MTARILVNISFWERGENTQKKMIDRDNSGTGNLPLQEVTTKKDRFIFLYTNASVPNPLCEIPDSSPNVGTILHIFGQQEVVKRPDLVQSSTFYVLHYFKNISSKSLCIHTLFFCKYSKLTGAVVRKIYNRLPLRATLRMLAGRSWTTIIRWRGWRRVMLHPPNGRRSLSLSAASEQQQPNDLG
jgi:hypothetical protein